LFYDYDPVILDFQGLLPYYIYYTGGSIFWPRAIVFLKSGKFRILIDTLLSRVYARCNPVYLHQL